MSNKQQNITYMSAIFSLDNLVIKCILLERVIHSQTSIKGKYQNIFCLNFLLLIPNNI
jgi:hypothetical protein